MRAQAFAEGTTTTQGLGPLAAFVGDAATHLAIGMQPRARAASSLVGDW